MSKQKNKGKMETNFHSAHLPDYISERLELHSESVYFGIWYKLREFQKTNALDGFLCSSVFSRLFLCT